MIVDTINRFYTSGMESCVYAEPFFGAGGIGLNLMLKSKRLRHIAINDFDIGVAAFWTAVIQHPDRLIEAMESFVPHPDRFYEYKEYFTTTSRAQQQQADCVEVGLKKMILHQISYSGLGMKAGGPLGGKSQKSDYKVDCRWNPIRFRKQIEEYHRLFLWMTVQGDQCGSDDFSTVISDLEKQDCCFYYLDPPYYLKGPDLYYYHFGKKDHARLAEQLRESKHSWLLSYDAADEIRKMYDWAYIKEVNVNYMIRTARSKPEFIIVPKHMKELLTADESGELELF